MILNKIAVAILALACLSVPTLAFKRSVSYTCDDDSYTFTVTILNESRLMFVDGAGYKATMKRQVSGSGLYYTGRDKDGSFYEFMATDNNALLILDRKYRHENCTVVGSKK